VEVDLPAVLCISLGRTRIVLAVVQHLGFVVCTPLDAAPLADHLARDKDHFYQNDEMIEETLWLERLHEMTQEP